MARTWKVARSGYMSLSNAGARSYPLALFLGSARSYFRAHVAWCGSLIWYGALERRGSLLSIGALQLRWLQPQELSDNAPELLVPRLQMPID